MVGLATEKLLTVLRNNGAAIKSAPSGWLATCPVPGHEDRNPSFSVQDGNGMVLYKCRSGCDQKLVTESIYALGLTPNDLYDNGRGVEYTYRDKPGGRTVRSVRRYTREGNKTFMQTGPQARGGRNAVLYRPGDFDLAAAVSAGMEIWIAEGEKDADTLWRYGIPAVSGAAGAVNWDKHDYSPLAKAARVTIAVDRDQAGYERGYGLYRHLVEAYDANVRVVEPASGSDVTDHFLQGHDVTEFREIPGDPEFEDAVNDVRRSWRVTREAKRRDAAPFAAAALENFQPKTLGEIQDAVEQDRNWVIPELLERQERFVLTGEEGKGKDLSLDTPLPTPTGWTTMGEVQAGDYVIGMDGKPTRVVGVTEVMHNPCYRVEFSDGTHIIAGEGHQWLTDDYRSRAAKGKLYHKGDAPTKPRGTNQRHKMAQPAIRTTRQLADTVHAYRGRLNHSIPAASAMQLPHTELPVAAYTMGAWLGDGTTKEPAITLNEEDASHIRPHLVPHRVIPSTVRPGSSLGIHLEGARGSLREAGVLGDKHIPREYLRASQEQRLLLLRGLMDTDGSIVDSRRSGRGQGAAVAELMLTSERLAHDAHELILSLGAIATISESDAKIDGRVISRRWRIRFQSTFNPFLLPRKAERWFPPRTIRPLHRMVTAVVPVESVPTRCIQVDNEDHMYLAGRQMVPTHNSHWMRQVMVTAAAGLHPFHSHITIEPMTVLAIDAENTELQWQRATRYITSLAAYKGVRSPRNNVIVQAGFRMDLTQPEHIAAIHRWIDEYKPDIVFLGPLYKLVPKEVTNDDDAAPLLLALDNIRERDVALLMEAHAGKGKAQGGERDLSPRGSSALLGWPEFGYGLRQMQNDPDMAVLVPWRSDREQRPWPRIIRRGQDGEYPWMPANV